MRLASRAAIVAVLGGVAGAVPARSVEAELARLAQGKSTSRVCFAISKDHRRVACSIASWVNHENANAELVVLDGTAGEAASAWSYLHVEGETVGMTPPLVTDARPATDGKALDDARAALADGGFVANTLPQVRIGPHDVVKVGRWRVRRDRVETRYPPEPSGNLTDPPGAMYTPQPSYVEHYQLKCAGGWVDLPLDPGHRFAVAGDHYVSMLADGLLLFTREASYGTEGDYGGERTATILSPALLCP